MLVTDLQYPLEKRLVKKLDIMIKRCTTNHPKRDALLLNEGGEGEGKTNGAIAESYYVKFQTKREIWLWFRLKEMIDFAKSTEEKIIIWDEPSLDSLSGDALKKLVKNLIRLLMTVRINRHFFIINVTKFHKFPEYIVVDRALAMIHFYSRNEVEPGRFVYIRRKNLEHLFNAYRNSKKRLYKKYTSFRGSFPDIMEKYFDKMGIHVNGIPNATFQIYEREKKKAIASIGEEEKQPKDTGELNNLKLSLSQLRFPIATKEQFAKELGVSIRTLQLWAKKLAKSLGKSDLSRDEGEIANDYNNKGG